MQSAENFFNNAAVNALCSRTTQRQEDNSLRKIQILSNQIMKKTLKVAKCFYCLTLTKLIKNHLADS